jgi:hypothetical protein
MSQWNCVYVGAELVFQEHRVCYMLSQGSDRHAVLMPISLDIFLCGIPSQLGLKLYALGKFQGQHPTDLDRSVLSPWKISLPWTPCAADCFPAVADLVTTWASYICVL